MFGNLDHEAVVDEQEVWFPESHRCVHLQNQSVLRWISQSVLMLSCRLPSVVSAAWQLHQQRVWLTAAGAGPTSDRLNPLLTHMRVVKEAQAELDQVTGR